MSFTLENKAIFSPLGQYLQDRATRSRKFRARVHGFTTKGLHRTLCELKPNKEGKEPSILNMQNGRLALKGLLGLASILVRNGITENSSEDDNIVIGEQLEAASSQMENVTEFGLCARPLDTVVRALVKRPIAKKELEILVVDGIGKLEGEETARFDVYINKAIGNMVDTNYGEFVGSEADCCNGSLEIDITDLVMAIGAEESENIVITFVPRSGKAIIGGVRVIAKRSFGHIQVNNFFTYRKDERRKLVMVDLKHQLQISENISLSIGLLIWLVPYFILLMPQVKDVFGELTRLLQ